MFKMELLRFGKNGNFEKNKSLKKNGKLEEKIWKKNGKLEEKMENLKNRKCWQKIKFWAI